MSETTARPIRSKALLAELQKLVKRLLEDLRERTEELEPLKAELTARYQAAFDAGSTAETYTAWREAQLTQVAVSWVLASVFVRYLEDNHFLDQPVLAGAGDARRRVQDRMSTYFKAHPTHTDREYLQDVFRTVAALPGCHELLGEDRNPLWRVGLSGDGAKDLLEYWQALDPATGELLRPLESPDGDTRFLGDLYQDLSEEARTRFALLQTPVFVEEFILDRTLEPALLEFGLEKTTLIDPTCGSGHFLLGAFARLLARWEKAEPGTNVRELARRALEAVHGVDINPFAVAVARFRLLLAFLRACGIRRLADCPDVHPRVATGDSLLHGRMVDAKGHPLLEAWPPDVVAAGDYEDAVRMLKASYAAVVGNPPYIVDRDKAHNAAVREHYLTAYRQYSLGVPFTERFFDLAHDGRSGRAGFVGMITTDTFMKREFGKKLIQEYLPRVDLTHVLDSSRAYIPGHGTNTVILVGRNRPPLASTIRAVLGIKSEPGTPEVPARGRVWLSLVELVDQAGSQNEFVSVSDVARATFAKHPWSMGGGGAAELKELIENSKVALGIRVEAIGRTNVVGEDEVWLFSAEQARRKRVDTTCVPFVIGEHVRDWLIRPENLSIYPYDQLGGQVLASLPLDVAHHLWTYRTLLNARTVFGKTFSQRGIPWYEHLEHYTEKLRTPLSIAFAFVTTHNHFVLDRGGKVFKQTAPIIKLPPGTSEDDHLALLGLLNSSVACFWLKQVSYPRGGNSDTHGWRLSADDPWDRPYEYAGTSLLAFPIPDACPTELAAEIDRCARQRAKIQEALYPSESALPDYSLLKDQDESLLHRMISLQEELDWVCYRLYGLVDGSRLEAQQAPPLQPGQRAFEIILARQIAAGDSSSTWFQRHRAQAWLDLPDDWPADYRSVVEARIAAIEENDPIRLVEQPEFKRRWQTELWDDRLKAVHRSWLLDRLESSAYWPDPSLTTCGRLADRARRDEQFVRVARLYTGQDDLDLTRLVSELVTGEAVPHLPVFRYKPSGLAKRAEWEKTWELQRREDAGEKVGPIPVPPKYASADFAKPHFNRLRGKLDVPRERFISFPGVERETDPSAVVGWAGWDQLQQAQALAAYYLDRKEQDGWPPERLMPLLSSLAELLPWLKQWHNDLHPEFGERMGSYYEAFTDQEARSLGTTLERLKRWTPTATTRGRGRSKASPE